MVYILNFICLTIEIVIEINNNYFNKIILENSRNKSSVVGFQYKGEILDVSKVFLGMELHISNMHGNQVNLKVLLKVWMR